MSGGTIFVNYRRVDAPYLARSLYERLVAAFRDRRVFMDVDSIPAGSNFRETITSALQQTDVLLAVVGPQWLDVRDDAGGRRLDNPEDWVRVELETARRLGCKVVPVLAGGARHPRAADLPDGLAWLAETHSLRVTPDRFDSDIEGLVRQLRGRLEEVAAERRRREQAAAAERARREQAVARRAEQEARQKHAVGLDPQHLTRAEALADWDEIRHGEDLDALREHIARFGDAVTVRLARRRLHKLEWRLVRSSRDPVRLRRFLDAHPDGRHTREARARLASLERRTPERTRPTASSRLPIVGIAVGIPALLCTGFLGLSALRSPSSGPSQGAPAVAPSQLPVDELSLPSDPSPGDAVETLAGELVWVPGGTFRMGSPPGGKARHDDERPVHDVTVSGLWVMRAELSQGLYRRLTGENPSKFWSCGDDCPVENVSWYDAVAFANRLSEQAGLRPAYRIDGTDATWNREADGYRLLTEAEWEYAARGGESYVYAGASDHEQVGWVKGNSDDRTHASCGKLRNGYGLCDMTGNVREWVWDWYGSYSSGALQDPSGPESGSNRVDRGGSWGNSADFARVAYRDWWSPVSRSRNLGFRLARPAP